MQAVKIEHALQAPAAAVPGLTVKNTFLQVAVAQDSEREQLLPRAASAPAAPDEKLRLRFRLWPADDAHLQSKGGIVKKNAGRYGFIEQDSGDGQIFTLPNQCGGHIPPVGVHVRFDIGTDPQKGIPLAVNVTLDGKGAQCPPTPRPARAPAENAKKPEELEEITCRLLSQLRGLS